MTDGGPGGGAVGGMESGGNSGGNSNNSNNPSTPPNTGKTTPTPQQQQQNKEVNTSTVCRIGQETVEEIVSRTQEVFSILKSLQPPVGSYTAQVRLLFREYIQIFIELFCLRHNKWTRVPWKSRIGYKMS
jgi:hypothetical protein